MSNENLENSYFEKSQKKSLPVYIEEKTKRDFQTICSRLGSSCNKEINNFIKEFNLKNKEVLNVVRK